MATFLANEHVHLCDCGLLNILTNVRLYLFLLSTSLVVAQDLQIKTISTRPEMVSGGNVLLQIAIPSNLSAQDVAIAVDGRDVTKDFQPIAEAGALLGLVSDLSVGRHTVVARAAVHGQTPLTATVEIVNHPITGPIFSGPHQAPFICETDKFTLPDGSTLGVPLDADCSAHTRVQYLYKSTEGSFKSLSDLTTHPPDLAQTTTTEGRTVPYIVRLETGTINRAIYQIWILHDPTNDPEPNPFQRPKGWNGNLIFTSGGGLAPGYHQGVINLLAGPGMMKTTVESADPYEKYRKATANLGAPNGNWLSRGYAYAQSTLNFNNANYNTVLSAESAMMIKEHFIKEFGPVRFTIGTGISGGSMQTNDVAQAYPGIFDGIIPSGFADNITTIHNQIDCALLDRAFKASTLPFTREQMTAVSGWGDWQGCEEWLDIRIFVPGMAVPFPQTFGHLIPSATPGKTLCSPVIPPELMYEPLKNPKGSRCTYQDNSVNIYGRDPTTGFARRPFDNIGVQYGLVAFNAGKISAEQFVQLNELAGGYDIDGNFIKDRFAADPEALRIAYRSGRINSGAGSANIPVILESWPSAPKDFRNGRISMFSVRARMIASNGHADNQVIVTASSIMAGGAVFIEQMDHWLENLAKDPAPLNREKFQRTRPADLTDGCYKPDASWIAEPADATDSSSACNQLYPVYGTPRIATGASVTDDILKCRLKPLSSRDYAQALTKDQLSRLKAVFPQGVCDYGRPGVGQQPVKYWLSYALRK
jgi:hypothetical protein